MGDFKKILELVNSKEEYIAVMQDLAQEKGITFKGLDKFHYMVNDKLALDSYLYTDVRQTVGDLVYCPFCGEAVGCPTYDTEQVWLYFPQEDKSIYLMDGETNLSSPEDTYCRNCLCELKKYENENERF